MKDYTVDDPKFSKKITITEITDTNHADNINKAPKQVFENTLFLEKSKVSANGGDVSDTIIQSAAAVEDEYPIPVAGDTPKTLLGKTKKFFESIKNWMTGVCLLGHIVNNCVTDRSDLPLSAAQGKALMDAVNVLNTKTIFEKIPPKKGDLDTIANINSALDNWSNSMSDRIFYIGLLPLGIAHTTFGGGTLNLFGSKTNATHEWQMLIKYDTVGIRIFTRCKTAGTWQAWVTK